MIDTHTHRIQLTECGIAIGLVESAVMLGIYHIDFGHIEIKENLVCCATFNGLVLLADL